MCPVPESFGVSRCREDDVVTRPHWLNRDPSPKAAKKLDKSVGDHLAMYFKLAPFYPAPARSKPSLTPPPPGVSARNLALERMSFISAPADAPHKLTKLGTCSWKSRLLPWWVLVRICSHPPD